MNVAHKMEEIHKSVVVEKRREKIPNDEGFRQEIEQRKLEQKALQERGSMDADEMLENEIKHKKAAKQKLILQHQKEREIQDKKMHLKLEEIAKQKRYKRNPGDTTDYASSESASDCEYESSADEEEEEDIAVALKKFPSIAAMGQLFYRYSGSRSRTKPQDRVVKVTFSADRKPFEISWGSVTRRILFADILYVCHGHYTPAFHVRSDVLSPMKCLSVVSKAKILDLEGYNEHITQLWAGIDKIGWFDWRILPANGGQRICCMLRRMQRGKERVSGIPRR